MSGQPKPNVGMDLMRIHRVVTRGLAVAQENCAAFAESGFPDDTTAEGFWKYCQALEATAHGHHVTEDDVAFPFLQERLPGTNFDELMVAVMPPEVTQQLVPVVWKQEWAPMKPFLLE